MSDNELTPPELKEAANSALKDLVPSKSSKTYEKWYKFFLNFLCQHNTNKISQNILLAFLKSLKTKNGEYYKYSSLYTVYSCLKKKFSSP